MSVVPIDGHPFTVDAECWALTYVNSLTSDELDKAVTAELWPGSSTLPSAYRAKFLDYVAIRADHVQVNTLVRISLSSATHAADWAVRRLEGTAPAWAALADGVEAPAIQKSLRTELQRPGHDTLIPTDEDIEALAGLTYAEKSHMNSLLKELRDTTGKPVAGGFQALMEPRGSRHRWSIETLTLKDCIVVAKRLVPPKSSGLGRKNVIFGDDNGQRYWLQLTSTVKCIADLSDAAAAEFIDLMVQRYDGRLYHDAFHIPDALDIAELLTAQPPYIREAIDAVIEAQPGHALKAVKAVLRTVSTR